MSTDIHPTAVVDSGAELGEDVRVGPYCVICAGVTIGDRCHLQNHVTVAGPTAIGAENEFFPYASIGQRSQDLKYEGEPTHLVIGEGNTFREFCTVNRGTARGSRTVIGRGGSFLAYSHVAHDCTVGDGVIFSNNGTLAGHVLVEDHAVIGGLTAVHQFCRIGTHAITGGCTKIVQDVPPYMVVDGNPGKVRSVNTLGLKRHGFSEDALAALKRAHRILYREKRNVGEALEALRERGDPTPEVERLVEFVAHSERGIA